MLDRSGAPAPTLDDYSLTDRYSRKEGRVFMTGTQALVRIALEQRARDRAAGLNTAGFISGYRGSPLGGYDQELWRARDLLEENAIEFLPAVNEDLAATAVLGSQQVETDPTRTVDGVFGIWYGKGPGVDRSGDALKHGNAYGSSPHGGVLVVAGDDHGCVSSSMGHQSDAAFVTFFMPILNPADIPEYLSFAEYGFALSRYTGMWVGFKAISETVESARSFELPPSRTFTVPDFEIPPTGLHYRWPDLPGPQIEERLESKKHATFAFAEANPIDRKIYDIADARYGIVTTGKGHLDLMEALRLLGLDEAACRRLGIDIYKVGMVWPLARRSALDFVSGKHEVLIVEEKRGIIESQFKEYFYDHPGSKPERMVGKNDENGERLLPWTGELSPIMLAEALAARLDSVFDGLDLSTRARQLAARGSNVIEFTGTQRTPYFCSGCPHNTSTKVPEGSQAFAGIGCHVMATWMDRNTSSLIQMGGEGVNWVTRSRFNGNAHVFQNLGDGTYYHSGSMAIRQAVAAKTNITYKILFNGAVAMTGGQPVDGPLSVETIASSVRAEGVERIAVVSDQPDRLNPSNFPAGVTIDHRRDLDRIQRELREIPGVTVLIYDQGCATEKRRQRKRGTVEDPKRFAYINDLVCEGCGDCSVASNCLSVEPRETPFGRKRKINLNTCNKDFSCLDGFCPSFVTVEGAERRRKSGAGDHSAIVAEATDLPLPTAPSLDQPYDLLVTGVGGTGVITVGALITMAAHLEGRGASVLDFTGFAQKFGPVLSYIRLAREPDAINQVRVEAGRADALIGCDLVTSVSPKASVAYHRDHTRAVVNSAEMPTGDFTRNPDADLESVARLDAIAGDIGRENMTAFDANGMAERVLGDTVFANVMMLGHAWQSALVPIGHDALMRAIELNGVAIERNKAAFAAGRLAAAGRLDFLLNTESRTDNEDRTLDAVVDRRAAFLEGYQDEALATRYRAFIGKVSDAETASGGGDGAFADAVARGYFKLLSYKDEYEVARLMTGEAFAKELASEFEGGFKINYHMAPPLLHAELDAWGRPRKRVFGPWLKSAMKVLARFKRLRGTPFDVFGYTAERRMERELIGWYEDVIERLLQQLDAANVDQAAEIAGLVMKIRGFGPVKEQAVRRVKAEVEAALEDFEAGGDCAPLPVAAE